MQLYCKEAFSLAGVLGHGVEGGHGGLAGIAGNASREPYQFLLGLDCLVAEDVPEDGPGVLVRCTCICDVGLMCVSLGSGLALSPRV